MAENIQPGDVVKLKSGGPAMTVSFVGDARNRGITAAVCMWFADGGLLQTAEFLPSVLEKTPK